MNQPRSRGSRVSIAAPNNVTLGAIVAVVAIVLGFFVLRDIDAGSGNGGSANNGGGGATQTTAAGGSGVTTTTIGLGVNSFTIQVANNSGVAGSAGKLTTQLQSLGYRVQAALNVSPGTVKRSRTGVFYVIGSESAANLVAQALGSNPEVGPMPQPLPLETGTLKDATVLILLGTDIAGKDIPGASSAGNGVATPGPQTTTTTTAG